MSQVFINFKQVMKKSLKREKCFNKLSSFSKIENSLLLEILRKFKLNQTIKANKEARIYIDSQTKDLNTWQLIAELRKNRIISQNSHKSNHYQNISYFKNLCRHKTTINNRSLNNFKEITIEKGKSYVILNSMTVEKLQPPSLQRKKFIFFTDLDDTLIKEVNLECDDCLTANEMLEEFIRKWLITVGFNKNAHFIITTGRTFQNFSKINLPVPFLKPKYVVCENGTLIYELEEKTNQYKIDTNWNKMINKDWNSKIVQQEFDKLSDILSTNQLSPHDVLGVRYRCDFDIYNKNIDLIHKTTENLKNFYKVDIRIFVCGNQDPKYIDIHPKNSGKENANRYLRERLKVDLKKFKFKFKF